MRCQLCGEFEREGRIFVAAQGEVCNSCICELVDHEIERRMEHQADGDPCRDYKAEFRDRQIEAQQLKR